MIREQDATFSLGSLDVYSVVTNILLNGTIDICVNQLFENANTVESFTNSRLKQLCLATKETFFMFNYLLYKQIHGVAMGAPLGPSLLNTFLSHHKKSGQTIIPKDLSKFFNDVISMVLLHFSNNHLKCFQDFMNSRHINMSFFLESEKENKLSFLDLEFICKQGKVTATSYRKSTFSGTYSNFESFSLLA